MAPFGDTDGDRGGDATASVTCPRCSGPLTGAVVRTVIWHGDAAAIVEDIPAHVCGNCMEQFYDDAVSDALRRLAERPMTVAEADRVATVPVFSLKSRLRDVRSLPEDAVVD
jgi:YgiT-type zinc finger domain-containing protein